MRANYASQVLTGDLRGLKYLERSFTEMPKNMFNFCCTVEGGIDMEKEFNMYKPQRMEKVKRRNSGEYKEEQARLADMIRRESSFEV
jgi:hypothetical protein